MLQTAGVALDREKLRKAAYGLFAAAFLLHTAFTAWRGVEAGRLPLANQFEFASGFAWSAAVMGLMLYGRMKQEWIKTVSMPVAFLVLSYAAFQPMEIKELMPALRSTWFALRSHMLLLPLRAAWVCITSLCCARVIRKAKPA